MHKPSYMLHLWNAVCSYLRVRLAEEQSPAGRGPLPAWTYVPFWVQQHMMEVQLTHYSHVLLSRHIFIAW